MLDSAHHRRTKTGDSGARFVLSGIRQRTRLTPSDDVCEHLHRATNLAIDDRLLEEALRIGGRRTKKETVTEALTEYIQRRKQQQLIHLFGTIDFDPKYDAKRQRRRR
jgi:hypothetical protein